MWPLLWMAMDGGQKKNNRPIIEGHRQGAQTAKRITKAAIEKGIPYLTLYTFSCENWRRDATWITDLLGLLTWYFKHEIDTLAKNGVRLNIIGDLSSFPVDLQDLIQMGCERTKNGDKITVTLALSYSGRDEIVRAVNQLLLDSHQGHIPSAINDKIFSKYLDTCDMPDPDLIIRTSGEKRISNYLLWQSAYSEFVFTDKLWPDFLESDFEEALLEYANRDRRFGKDSMH